jgi:hypothetical protein
MIITDKDRSKGGEDTRCQSHERQRDTSRGDGILSHTWWRYQVHFDTSTSLVQPDDRTGYVTWTRSRSLGWGECQRVQTHNHYQVHLDTSISLV